ncbi:unnamed protein product [Owenia fusiformis]|uniref:Uncharacterized protein n=1 Tax=Owenia fusiformis TaxID=6347 RepID=A0A8J1TJK7_OWEFU|nr:unnamed protein product [Owenia fusiformis]CAH1778110.1 unnamed protein product [Owenia fusiformis]
MATISFAWRDQLSEMEKSLNVMKKSKMMNFADFKSMFGMIEIHHKDIKLAHLTGKSKDLMEQAYEDTQFFFILMKMLGEVSDDWSPVQQKQNLQKVNKWYMANKHILHCQPHFGKEHQLEKRKHIIEDAKKPPTFKFKKENRPMSSKKKPHVNNEGYEVESIKFLGKDGKTRGSRPSTANSSKKKTPFNSENNTPSSSRPGSSTRKSAMKQDAKQNITPATETSRPSSAASRPTSARPGGIASRPGSGVIRPGSSLRRLGDMGVLPQEADIPPNPEDLTIQKMKQTVYPLTHLINPHTNPEALEMGEQEGGGSTDVRSTDGRSTDGRSTPMSIKIPSSTPDPEETLPEGGRSRPLSAAEVKNGKLQQWETFKGYSTHGQEVLAKLQHAGRSGTPHSIRYVAHDHATRPEHYTFEVLSDYAQWDEKTQKLKNYIDPKMLVKQNLEEFYEMAENYYPPNLPQFQGHTRPNTAPSKGGRSVSFSPEQTRSQSAVYRKKLPAQKVYDGNADEKEVGLDTVVTILDSVTGDMVGAKEKVAPEPAPGFRSPMVKFDVTTRPRTAPPRVCTSPASSDEDEDRMQLTDRDILASRQINITPPQNSTHDARTPRDAPTMTSPVVQAIDWRGRIAPESTRYKWKETSFGHHTYVKEMKKQPSTLRTAGATHAGKRPKTAPVSVRDKWKTEKPNDDNQPIHQAASHQTTEIDPDTVNGDFMVQKLGRGKNKRLQKRMQFMVPSRLEAEMWKYIAAQESTPNPMQFLTFCAPASVQGSRPASRMTGPRPDSEVSSLQQPRVPYQTPVPYDGASTEGSIPHLNLPNGMTLNSDSSVDLDVADLGDLDDLDTDRTEADNPTTGDNISADVYNEDADVPQRVETPPNTELSYDGKETTNTEEKSMKEVTFELPSTGNDNVADFDINDPTGDDNVDNEKEAGGDNKNSVNFKDMFPVRSKKGKSSQTLSQSPLWNFAPDFQAHKISKDKMLGLHPNQSLLIAKRIRGEHWSKAVQIPENYCDGCVPPSISPTPRSARSRPYSGTPTKTAHHIRDESHHKHIQAHHKAIQQQQRMLHRKQHHPTRVLSAPVRTRPSIPSPSNPYGGRSPRHGSAFAPELEHHARTIKSPRHYMEKVVDLRRKFGEVYHPHSEEQDDPPGDLTDSITVRKFYKMKQRSPAHINNVIENPAFTSYVWESDEKSRRVTFKNEDEDNFEGGENDFMNMDETYDKHPSDSENVPNSEHVPIGDHVPNNNDDGVPENNDNTAKLGHNYSGAISNEDEKQVKNNTTGDDENTSRVENTRRVENTPDADSCEDQTADVNASINLTPVVDNTSLDLDVQQDTVHTDRTDDTEHHANSPKSQENSPKGSTSFQENSPIESHVNFTETQADESFVSIPTAQSSSSSLEALDTIKSEPNEFEASGSNLARIGRPIAQVSHIPDPVEEFGQVKRQKEAKAAVDIQRIFRGYVARNVYKKLQSEERMKLEDERVAAVQIQRHLRGHISRKSAIYNRKPGQETLEWARDFKKFQKQRKLERHVKNEIVKFENQKNHHISRSKINIIGPHVDIYQNFNPVKEVIDKNILRKAAICIQRHVRGMLTRKKFEKTKRKALQHAPSWSEFIKDYKGLLTRIQKRHYVSPLNIKTPFNHQQVNTFMDLKKRYDSVFEKKAFGGQLEVNDLPSYFKECDLYPSNTEIEEAYDKMFKGKNRKGKGLIRQEVLELTFTIYVPPGTGLTDTRKSTWMNPLIDGEEGNKLRGHESVEPAPLGPCFDLVAASMKDRKDQNAAKQLKEKQKVEAENEEKRRVEKKERRESLQSMVSKR